MKEVRLLFVLIVFVFLSCEEGGEEPTDSQPQSEEGKTLVIDMDFGKALTNRHAVKGAMQADGKIVIVGDEIIRLNPDGNRDPTFVTQEFDKSVEKDIVVQPDGKILVASIFSAQPTGIINLIRLNADGSVDTNFNFIELELSGHASPPVINIIHLTDNGKIIIGGNFDYFYKSRWYSAILRLNSDGSFDDTFKTVFENRSEASGGIKEIHDLPDGSLLLVGSFYILTDSEEINNVIKVNKNGAMDPSFRAPSFEFGNAINTASVLDDGRIIVGGSFSKDEVTDIAILKVDGSIDNTFKTNQNQRLAPVVLIQPLPKGNFIVGRHHGADITRDPLSILDAKGNDEGYKSSIWSYSFSQILSIEDNNYILFGSFVPPGGSSTIQSLIKLKIE